MFGRAWGGSPNLPLESDAGQTYDLIRDEGPAKFVRPLAPSPLQSPPKQFAAYLTSLPPLPTLVAVALVVAGFVMGYLMVTSL